MRNSVTSAVVELLQPDRSVMLTPWTIGTTTPAPATTITPTFIPKIIETITEDTEPLREPGRGLDDLPELVDQSRKCGLPVTLRQDRPREPDQRRPLRDGRHRGHGHQHLGGRPLGRDDGTPAQISDGAGIGIRGMRESVTAAGGYLEAPARTTRRCPAVDSVCTLKEAPTVPRD
jgi:hypothetical protein